MDRRNFIKTSSAGLITAATGSTLLNANPIKEDSKKKLFDISLAQWSFNKSLFGRGGRKKMDNLDYAKAARKLGIGAIEYVNQFFKDKARNEKYLAEMKKRAKGEGVKSLLIMVDGEGRLGDPDSKRRAQAVENHHRWVVAAWYLGCHSIRVNAGSKGSYEEQMKLAADGLRSLSEYGDKYGINVIVENHGGLSSNGAWLAGVMKQVNHPRCGTLPDFGNFRIGGNEWYDRYKGVKELMPYAKAVSAKSHDFDDKGNETKTDYFKMMKIVLDAGYKGYVGIEYEGGRLNEVDGITATKKLLERVRDKLS